MTPIHPTLTTIREAQQLLAPYFSPTRMVPAPDLTTSAGFPASAFLKRETDLPTASFKPRGALYALATNLRRRAITEVIASSTGNHGAAVAWAALVPPDCYTAYAFSKRALQATTMAAIDHAARLDRDWLSRGMSDLGSIHAHARRYKELKGREITWPLPA